MLQMPKVRIQPTHLREEDNITLWPNWPLNLLKRVRLVPKAEARRSSGKPKPEKQLRLSFATRWSNNSRKKSSPICGINYWLNDPLFLSQFLAPQLEGIEKHASIRMQCCHKISKRSVKNFRKFKVTNRNRWT